MKPGNRPQLFWRNIRKLPYISQRNVRVIIDISISDRNVRLSGKDGFTLRTLSSGTTFTLQDVLTKFEVRLEKATYSVEYSDIQTIS